MSVFTNVEIKNTATCLSAYNKKQEFAGGYISVINFNCNNYNNKINIDKISKILILNES